MKTAGRIILFASVVALAVVPLFARADNASGIPYWANGGLLSCTGNYVNGAHPCTSVCDLIQTIVNVIYFGITICLFVLAPIFFTIGGVMLMVSGANPEMMSRGKGILLNTVIGVVIVLCSYLIVFTFVNVFGASVNGQPAFNSTFSCVPQYPTGQ
ncbi:MAG TPA: pilin [Candidatus Paceibacterota bacterium]|nr:pilin [Candidatus Paceibacterota bacterium]